MESQRIQEKERSVSGLESFEMKSGFISIVIPVVERWGNLAEIYEVHSKVLKIAGLPFEFIFVVDGGYEESTENLRCIENSNGHLRVITLPRQFGEATALAVGFEQAQGDVLVTLSSYLQVAPEGLLEVLRMLDKGFDLAIARRHPRVDSWINRIQNLGFHFLTRRLTGVQLHDISCGLKAMKRPVVREIPLYGDLHRFLPLLAYQKGFRVVEVDIPQHPADRGTRIYRPGVYLRRLLDILTLVFLFKFTKKPLRFFGLIGAGLFGAGLLISSVLAVQRILGLTALADRPLLILGVLLMVLGIQTGSIGLLGEMIIFTHARKTKDYNVDRILK